ncbi:MAG: hypothetical protein J6U48_04950 [Alistipes sp.]|nr:hypothetical protein [Alistipes sp.]
MGCLSITATPVKGIVTKTHAYRGQPYTANVVGTDVVVFAQGIASRRIFCSIICSIPEGYVIRFVKSLLKWAEEDNQVGVTKYNTLIASGEWSLEEVIIEELL